jgi:O-antigen/teichoic acid export membrane protein
VCVARVRHQITPLISGASSGIVDFGSKVFLTNIVNWVITNADSFFIGRFFDVVTLGIYNRAFHLVNAPMQNVVITLQRVAFSTYSRMQEDLQTIRQVYFASVGFMSVLMLPAYGCVALIPEAVIYGLFGHQWAAAVPLVVPLALAMPFHAAMALNGPMLWAGNRVEREFRAQAITAIVLFVVLLMTATISTIAVAWGVLVITIFRFIVMTREALRTIDGSWNQVFRCVRGGLVVVIPAGTMVFFCDQAVASLNNSEVLRLVLDLLVGGLFVLGMILFVPNIIISFEMRWFCERLNRLLPASVRPLMRRIVSLPSVST